MRQKMSIFKGGNSVCRGPKISSLILVSLNVKETESAVFLFPAKAKEDEIVGVVMCVGALNRGSCVLVVSVAAKALCKCVMLAATMSW